MGKWIYTIAISDHVEADTGNEALIVKRYDEETGQLLSELEIRQVNEHYNVARGLVSVLHTVTDADIDFSEILHSLFGDYEFVSVSQESEQEEENDDQYARYNFVVMQDTVVIVKISMDGEIVDGEINTVTIERKNVPEYAFMNVIKATDSERYSSDREQQNALRDVYNHYDYPTYIENITEGNIIVDRERGVMYYKCPITEEETYFGNRLRDRIIDAFTNEDDHAFESLIAFANNLA